MKILSSLGDHAIQQELGQRLTKQRLYLGLTQAQLAGEAGVSKRTVERVEAGESAQLSIFIRILRALRLAENLEGLVREPPVSPFEVLRSQKKERRRARSSKKVPVPQQNWHWDDEKI